MSGIIGVSPDMRSGVIGRFPTHHVLQVKHHLNITNTSITDSAAIVILTKTFNRLSGSSHFVCTAHVAFGMYTQQGNQDTADPRLWWTVNGSQRTTKSYLTDNGFYYSDYPSWYHGDAEQDGMGDVFYYHGSEDFTHISAGNVGDSVTIAVTADAAALGIWINQAGGGFASGGVSSLKILEVQ